MREREMWNMIKMRFIHVCLDVHKKKVKFCDCYTLVCASVFSAWWMCGTCYTLSHFIPSLSLALVIGIEERKEGNFSYVRALTTKFLLKMSEILMFFMLALCTHANEEDFLYFESELWRNFR